MMNLRKLCVDNFAVVCSSTYMLNAKKQTQNCLNRIAKWVDKNSFQFSKTKTVGRHFCNKRSLQLDPQLKINGTVIPIVH